MQTFRFLTESRILIAKWCHIPRDSWPLTVASDITSCIKPPSDLTNLTIIVSESK